MKFGEVGFGDVAFVALEPGVDLNEEGANQIGLVLPCAHHFQGTLDELDAVVVLGGEPDPGPGIIGVAGFCRLPVVGQRCPGVGTLPGADQGPADREVLRSYGGHLAGER
ncbi:hypothetical protein UQW22_05420 [Isoptericola halotolerans]|uniref:hypothetical protein n=1 Tax=Isoptericola halotolerans TaxID=300560 RepID=UPI00388EB818